MAGFEQEKADQLLMENVKVVGSMRTIGLANIKNRIHHIYGDQYGISEAYVRTVLMRTRNKLKKYMKGAFQ